MKKIFTWGVAMHTECKKILNRIFGARKKRSDNIMFDKLLKEFKELDEECKTMEMEVEEKLRRNNVRRTKTDII